MRNKLRFMCSFLAGFLVITIAGSSVAIAEATGSSTDEDSVPIANGNLLQIQVNGDDESITRAFSGRFRVGNDGSIDYPTLGRIVVNGRTITQVARMIDNPLHEHIRFSGTTVVSVAEYSPVFLLGSVQKPGPAPYEPGITVFRLILASGGLAQSATAQGGVTAQEVPALELRRFSLETRKARMVAELGGKDFDEVPKTSVGYDVNVLSDELAAFSANNRAKNSQMTALEIQRRTSEEEISSLEQSIVLQEKQRLLFQENFQRQQDLSDRGLLPKSRVSELKREIIAMELQTLQFQTALYRAKQERLTIDQRFTEAKINEEARNLESIHELDLQLRETEFKLKLASAPLADAEGSMHSVFGWEPTYTLIRRNGASYVAAIVDERFKLEQGDILRVDLPALQSSSGAAARGGALASGNDLDVEAKK